MSTFDLLFETPEDTLMRYPTHYNFFYFRQSPRGNSKFGITHLLWERLRMQQQGTDEPIQFDHAWMMKASSESKIIALEEAIKKYYATDCLFKDTARAGHTEWFKNVRIQDFTKKLTSLAEQYEVTLVKIVDKNKPYKATRSSECPFGSPHNGPNVGKRGVKIWAAQFWKNKVEKILVQ